LMIVSKYMPYKEIALLTKVTRKKFTAKN